MEKKKRIASVSFWIIMAIHLVVFSAIGIFTTRGWRLLIIFLVGLAATILVGVVVRWIVNKKKR